MSIATVSRLAFRDISQYLMETHQLNKHELGERFITPKLLDTKETRKLNRELGLHEVNYFNNTNLKN